MKSIQFQWGCIVLCLVLVFYSLFIKRDKIGYVESSRIYQEFNGAKKEREKLEAKANAFKLKIDTLNRELKETIIRHEGSNKQAIYFKQKQLDDYQRSVQETLQSEEAASMSKIATELNSYLKEYGKRNHYKFILIANQSGTIAYAEEGTDVTEDILMEINKK